MYAYAHAYAHARMRAFECVDVRAIARVYARSRTWARLPAFAWGVSARGRARGRRWWPRAAVVARGGEGARRARAMFIIMGTGSRARHDEACYT